MELKPVFSDNIGKETYEELTNGASDEVKLITLNLLMSIKIIGKKVLKQLPISGNVQFDDIWDEVNEIKHNFVIRDI